jgi:hypothetical protein
MKTKRPNRKTRKTPTPQPQQLNPQQTPRTWEAVAEVTPPDVPAESNPPIADFGLWWRANEWPAEGRPSFNAYMLGTFLKNLVASKLWDAWSPDQRARAASVLADSCDNEHEGGTFGILTGLAPEVREELRSYLGRFFIPTDTPSDYAFLQWHLDHRGIAVKAEDALFIAPVVDWVVDWVAEANAERPRHTKFQWTMRPPAGFS